MKKYFVKYSFYGHICKKFSIPTETDHTFSCIMRFSYDMEICDSGIQKKCQEDLKSKGYDQYIKSITGIKLLTVNKL